MGDDSSEKTEEPTPHKLREARKKGQIAKGKDLTGAIAMLAIFFILNRQVKTDLSIYIVLLTPLIFLIGFYDGFFGPGTGSFFVMLFLIFKNQTLLESTATSKLLNFASNFAAFIIFAVQGYVIWELGNIMAVGGITGAYLGSKSAIKVGDKLIRSILVVVSILLSLRILFS